MSKKGLRFGASVTSVVAALASPAAFAQEVPEAPSEEVVITGSFIRGTPEDAALPVDVIGTIRATPIRPGPTQSTLTEVDVSRPDAMRIVAVRGRAMQAAAEARPGTMTALLGVGVDDAAALCDLARANDVLLIANENSPQQSVISGSVAAIERAEALASVRKIRAVRLNVAGAFHSPLMEPAVEPLSAAIDEATFAAPTFPVASNVAGTLVSDPQELRALAKRHVVSPVCWSSCAAALQEAGADTFVEAGPGDVLTKLAKRVVPDAGAVAVGSPDAAVALAAERR